MSDCCCRASSLGAGQIALQDAAVWPSASKRNGNVSVTVAKFVGTICCHHVCDGVHNANKGYLLYFISPY